MRKGRITIRDIRLEKARKARKGGKGGKGGKPFGGVSSTINSNTNITIKVGRSGKIEVKRTTSKSGGTGGTGPRKRN